MPRVSQLILVQSIAGLARSDAGVDERAVLHAAALKAGADPLLDLGNPRFRRSLTDCLRRVLRRGLAVKTGGEVSLTEEGWGASGLERPKGSPSRRPAPPRNLPERVASDLRRAGHRIVRVIDLTLGIFGDAITSKVDVDKAVAAVRAALPPNVQNLPSDRVRENMVEEVTSPLLLPPASFRDPVLRAMAARTGGQPEHPLPKSAIIEEALRHLGIGTDPSEMKQLSGRVLRGLSVGATRLVLPASPHLWVLTPDGARLAAPLIASFPASRRGRDANVTARWIREHDGKGLRVEVAKKIARKCPVSSRINTIDDHVQEFFTRLIRRDALRSRIEAGLSIPYSLVASWGVRSAFVDFRNAGTEPVCREQHGARTEKEVRTLRASGEVAAPARKPGSTLLTNLPDPGSSIESVEETIWFNQFWMRFEGIIRARFPRDADLYMQVLRAKLAEESISNIADQVGVNERRVRAILKDVGGLRAVALGD